LITRALSSIPGDIFCYTSMSSASIVSILPGYLVLSSSLELSSKNILCGSVKMVYALIYTLFLGFGLQIGSDFYLLLDHGARQRITAMALQALASVSVEGTLVSDNSTSYLSINDGDPIAGTFAFQTDPSTIPSFVQGCYRPPSFPWYLQSFPWWTQFIIVPVFALTSSLSNMQPLWNPDTPVMVIIASLAYAANKVVSHFIQDRSDIVATVGAMVVGALGNIYSRKMGGTAFTAMVTGVLFLVPSGLSEEGGISAQGSGVDVGGAMIHVIIGITVGLFVSQSIVYMFGEKKRSALFSF